eukprot:1141157-Pelagomonas_calceolata.AAC.4
MDRSLTSLSVNEQPCTTECMTRHVLATAQPELILSKLWMSTHQAQPLLVAIVIHDNMAPAGGGVAHHGAPVVHAVPVPVHLNAPSQVLALARIDVHRAAAIMGCGVWGGGEVRQYARLWPATCPSSAFSHLQQNSTHTGSMQDW